MHAIQIVGVLRRPERGAYTEPLVEQAHRRDQGPGDRHVAAQNEAAQDLRPVLRIVATRLGVCDHGEGHVARIAQLHPPASQDRRQIR
ncbi:hypothetical protein D3C81_1772870 [compost metagenome]